MHAGVTIRYSDPSRLGVDRWLAMLAAHAASTKACLVVDCGTALTIDKLTASGEHCGGYIIPGLALMRRSLEENTRIRLNKEFEAGGVALGHSTDEAVYHGSLAAAVALIRAKFEESSQERKSSVSSLSPAAVPTSSCLTLSTAGRGTCQI